MFGRNIISARADHLRMRNSCNRVREPTLSLLLYKNIQSMFCTHTHNFSLLLVDCCRRRWCCRKMMLRLRTFFCWIIIQTLTRSLKAAMQHAKRFSAHNLWDSRWAFRFADWMTLADHHYTICLCVFEQSTLSISLLTLSKTNCQV